MMGSIVDERINNILLTVCSCLSCFAVTLILFQFMNDRYHRAFRSKAAYYLIGLTMPFAIAFINLLKIPVLNLGVWMAAIVILSCIFYYDETDRAWKRVIECEVLFLFLSACESVGVLFVDWVLKLFEPDIQTGILCNCLEITFSKVIVIFMYYMVFVRMTSKKKIIFTGTQWAVNFIILAYSLANLLMIAEGVMRGEDNFILLINMGCIVLADMFLLYFLNTANEKNYLQSEIKILEKQASMQYEYYLSQEKKYNATVRILHDVDKHITGLERLYANGKNDTAAEYAREIKDMLEPLIPVKYTGNPILDIILADKSAISTEKKIRFDVNVENIKLDFLEAIDATTIFGNLLDNAIEAAEKTEEDRFIHISISPRREMALIRIENTSPPLKWKNGMPVSQKGKNHGLGLLNVKRCIEKYDGDIAFHQKGSIVTVDILLNS